jgi:hypothetical protein
MAPLSTVTAKDISLFFVATPRGVVSVVEDDKPGVDGDRAMRPGRLDGTGVTSKTVICFIHDDIMAP